MDAVKKPAIPKGYESEEQFLSEMRENYDRGMEADEHNRIAAIQDIEFTYGDQWDDTVRNAREKRRKPVLTVNRLPAYVAQIVNNRLLNETEIRVYPERDGTKDVAELRQGLLRAIFKTRESDFARDEAMKYQVICGVGYFTLTTEYAGDEVFDQNIVFKPVVDPLSVVLDPLSVMPCGGDADYGFVGDNIPRNLFKKKYPWAAEVDFDSNRTSTTSNEWFSDDAVKVVSYWRMVEKGTKTIVLLADGQHKEIKADAANNIDVEAALEQLTLAGMIATRPDGTPYIKEVPNRCAEMYLCSGSNILEGPYTLPISSIPIYRVPGWEMRNGDKVYRWGLVRFLKDPQRLHNYQRSLLAEQMVAAPRNKWIATRDAITGYEKEWQNSHLSDDPLLIYNSDGQRPERIPAPQIDQALLTETQMTVQDIRDVSNIHEAALGMKSNEVSAKAINARQQMTDLGSFLYTDRLRLAEERAAKNCNELIPTVFDTQRIVSIMGADEKVVQAVLNDPTDPMSNISVGKYGLAVTTGPSTITKRAAAAEQMMAFVNAVPDTAALVMDLVAEAQDWPKAQEFAERFRKANGMIDPEKMTPEMQQEQAMAAQKQQITDELDLRKAMAEIAKDEAETEERKANAMLKQAQAYKAISDADSRAEDVAGNLQRSDFDAKMKVVETAITATEREDANEYGTDDDA
jgi:hypothetical protein